MCYYSRIERISEEKFKEQSTEEKLNTLLLKVNELVDMVEGLDRENYYDGYNSEEE